MFEGGECENIQGICPKKYRDFGGKIRGIMALCLPARIAANKRNTKDEGSESNNTNYFRLITQRLHKLSWGLWVLAKMSWPPFLCSGSAGAEQWNLWKITKIQRVVGECVRILWSLEFEPIVWIYPQEKKWFGSRSSQVVNILARNLMSCWWFS